MKKRKQASGMDSGQGKFKLPPDVSFHMEDLSFGVAFVFRHHTLGELGRVVVEPRNGGTTSLTCEVVGDPADPMTETRAAIFKPLGLELTGRVAAIAASYPDAPRIEPSSFPPYLKGVVESELIPCERCAEMAAMLIFAGSNRRGPLRGHARLMYPEYTRLNLPAWIIGPDLSTDGGPMQRPSHILKVWPVREALRRSSPVEFNPLLEKVLSAHCRARRKK
jgi:hypothetical protein